jgi:hypothetical protein
MDVTLLRPCGLLLDTSFGGKHTASIFRVEDGDSFSETVMYVQDHMTSKPRSTTSTFCVIYLRLLKNTDVKSEHTAPSNRINKELI